jgi:hypothetical protein
MFSFFMTRSFILSCMLIIVNAEMSKQDWLQTNICKKRLKIAGATSGTGTAGCTSGAPVFAAGF